MKERAAGCMEAMGEFGGAASKAPGLFGFSDSYLTGELRNMGREGKA